MISRSLYIHMPWCIQKCPYCDFNSHKSPKHIPEDDYIQALIADFKADLAQFPDNQIHSIFFGGGTPSLFSAKAYEQLLNAIQNLTIWEKDIEITLEANPGTFEQQRFKDYRTVGINRLSLGIQSFNPAHLKRLGRIHDEKQAMHAIHAARKAGFDNINLDIMHGLPGQSLQEGLDDLQQALNLEPQHLSWYQLTIEPNTVFHKTKPKLPDESITSDLEDNGLQQLSDSGYQRYEVSAFCKSDAFSKHNLNYWLYGDYFGIGAGAHGKLTTADNQVFRTQKNRQPDNYMKAVHFGKSVIKPVSVEDLIFEFMLNTSRLEQPIPFSLFAERTDLENHLFLSRLKPAIDKGLITTTDSHWQVTSLGRRYTNDLQALFLP